MNFSVFFVLMLVLVAAVSAQFYGRGFRRGGFRRGFGGFRRGFGGYGRGFGRGRFYG